MASSLPSSFGKAAPPQYVPPQPQQKAAQAPSQGTNGILIVAVIVALVLSAASFYGTFFMDRPLSANQKEQLTSIANDLASLQNRNMELSAPVSTTIYLNASYPIKDMFPAQFNMPLQFAIPVNTQLQGISSTGQPVSFIIQNESVPVNLNIPITSATAFGNNTIQIQQTIPVQTQLASTISVRAAYGQDLNAIIDQLNAMAGQSSPQ